MIKKVFVGIVIAAVFGLLVLGAVNRTLAKAVENEPLTLSEGIEAGYGSGNARNSGGGSGNGTGNGANASGGGQNSTGNGTSSNCDGEVNVNSEENGNPDGNGAGNPALDGDGYKGSGNNGAGQGGSAEGSPADGLGEGEAEVEEWVTIEGTVQSMEDDLWMINLSDGTVLALEGRTLSFAEELGFSTNVGNILSLTGFYEDGEFEVGTIDDLTTGERVTVRNESGRPLWAGGRRGGNN